MACGCNDRNANPDFPSATATPDTPVNVNVSAEGDSTDIAAGGFSLSSVEWWQWVLVAIAVILLLREK